MEKDEKGSQGEGSNPMANGIGSSHRGRLDIIANILVTASDGVRKTAIMYRCNLSFRQLETYLEFLQEKGLLNAFTRRQRRTSVVFETTDKGMNYLQAYRSLAALMSM